jgi:hypothetical protein
MADNLIEIIVYLRKDACAHMERSLSMVLVGAVVLAELSLAASRAQDAPVPHSSSWSAPLSSKMPPLPPPPGGVSTILGGEIRSVNPVLDQFSLHIYGERPMKILYNARTRVYRNGKPISVFDLEPEDHASVQTVLDGSNVYAISIHILSQAPEGDCRGLVLSYNHLNGELAVDSNLSPQPIHLLIPPNTPVSRVGERSFTSQQSGLSDLVRGTLIAVRFAPGPANRAVAKQITILAVPGSNFIFAGNITYLDVPAGRFVLVDPRDGKNYQISFDPSRFPVSANLKVGETVTVTASYNGTSYVANEIVID